MFYRTTGVVPTPAGAEPTSLLHHLSGEFALRVARLWPSPHAPFLTAEASRRHLLCLAFSLGRDVGAHAEAILSRRLPLAIAAAVGAPPVGLARALGRMGETAWSASAYRDLLVVLAHPKAAKVLRHAEQIQPDLVQRLAALPPPLSEVAGLAAKLDPRQLALLAEAYEALTFQSGRVQADAAAARWRRHSQPKALFEAVKADLCPEPAAPPHAGGPRLRPLTSKAEFAAAARRYRNCLADQTPYAASGWCAYYEWMGEPGAMIEITRDHIFGWRLEQARIAGNRAVPEALREEIISELALMGVHVGRSGWELERALSSIEGARRAPSVEETVAEVFGVE